MTALEYDNTLHDLLGTVSGSSAGFPTEERRLGFDNNAAALTSSPILVEQYLLAAEKAAAGAVATNLASLVACDPVAAGIDACGQKFIGSFGASAYRRPLDADDTALLTTVFNVGKATDFKTGVRLVIETVLQSPRFLYRPEFGVPPKGSETVVKPDDWEMASRLSYFMWHSLPDAPLLAAAAAGKLTERADIEAQVSRMLADPKARGMVADFNSQWLRVGEIAAIEKDRAAFPAFSPAIAQLMQQETARFLDAVTWEGDGNLAALFGAPFSFMNASLAKYYGVTGVGSDAFIQVPLLATTQRAGLLTQGGVLALLGKANQTSPVHRGKFVREQLLCTDLPPPPADLMIKPPELSATLTTRQRFTQHATDVACSGCHHLMDPIGLGFENFDGAGIFRAVENGQTVDAHGEVASSDIIGPFNGVAELAGKLAASQQVRACVATKWFRYAYGRGETAGDACSLGTIESKFAAGGYRFRDLLMAMTQSDAFLYRRVTPPAPKGGP
jgi:hypothetical protein